MKFNPSVNKVPTVSVCMITYNHEAYVARAIEGILCQKTAYSYELVIGDDCSTDQTKKICEEYVKKYPNIIRLITSERNFGSRGVCNFIKTFQNCNGKYIAICEGDDFWIDSNKLQKQINCLEANKSFSMVASNTEVLIHETGDIYSYKIESDYLKFEDFLLKNQLGKNTCTVIFRKKNLSDSFLKFLKQAPFGDWLIWLENLRYGNCFILRDNLACYRIHHKGAWNSLNETDKILNQLKMFAFIKYRYFTNKFIFYRNVSKFLAESNVSKYKKFFYYLYCYLYLFYLTYIKF